MSATPFRSHLLQQWTRSNQARPPAAVVTWLKCSSSPTTGGSNSNAKRQHHDATISGTTTNNKQLPTTTHPPGSPSSPPSSPRTTHVNSRHHSHSTSDRSVQNNNDPILHPSHHQSPHHRSMPPSLSTIDSKFSWHSASPPSNPSPSNSPRTSTLSAARSARNTQTIPMRHHYQNNTPLVATAPHAKYFTTSRGASTIAGKQDSASGNTDDTLDADDYDANDPTSSIHSTPSSSVPEQALVVQSVIMSRTTSSQLIHQLPIQQRQEELLLLSQALDRAVHCAQMAPNHKCTEPFSFLRFMSGSTTAATLADIAHQVVLSKATLALTQQLQPPLTQTPSSPVAQNSTPTVSSSDIQAMAEAKANSKRQKWLEIPAFLVAIVHKNHDPLVVAETTTDTVSDPTFSTNSDTNPLPYLPPRTERQLEDVSYSSVCIRVLHPLIGHIDQKWCRVRVW